MQNCNTGLGKCRSVCGFGGGGVLGVSTFFSRAHASLIGYFSKLVHGKKFNIIATTTTTTTTATTTIIINRTIDHFLNKHNPHSISLRRSRGVGKILMISAPHRFPKEYWYAPLLEKREAIYDHLAPIRRKGE